MAAEPSRLETLRRRVQQDPASFAFAALAEEYRRCGHLDDAVATCRKGLELHPSYTAGRVTLARALTALSQLDEARAEFEEVLKTAPENLAARRGLGEVQRETGDLAGALDTFRLAVALAPQDPELAQCVASLEYDLAAAAPVAPYGASAPTDEPPPRDPRFELQVVVSAPFPGDADLAISTGGSGPSTGGVVEPAGSLTLVSDADADAAPAAQWLDAWDVELPVEAPGDTPLDVVGDTPLDVLDDPPLDVAGETPLDVAGETPLDVAGETPLDAAVDTPLDVAAVREVGEEDPGAASGGDPVGVVDVAAANPQPAVPEHVPEIRADPGPGDVAPAEPSFAEPAPVALIEPDAWPAAPVAADDAWSSVPTDEPESVGAAVADVASPSESRGSSLGFDIPSAEVLVLPDRGPAPADDDGPPDPRLDALETFLDAIVRARFRA